MDSRHFLPLPIRLRHEHEEFPERLARLGPLCLRVKNLAVEMASMADPGGAVLRHGGVTWLPSAGLTVTTGRIAGVHALRAGRPGDYPGVLEMDFVGERHPVGFAVPPDARSTAALRQLVADFCVREMEVAELLEWRAALTRPFQPCGCCKSAMELRRAHAAAHPLAPILADAADSRLELHCRVGGEHFALERFLIPARTDLEGALTVHDREATTLLRIDPALTHSVTITATTSEGEARTLVRVHDLLGKEALSFSAPGDRHAARWRRYCAAAGN